MTVRTIKTNEVESNRIADHHQRFILRSSNERYRHNDIFHLQCYKNGKPVAHKVNKPAWVITLIMDDTLLPLEKGYQLIGFREL